MKASHVPACCKYNVSKQHPECNEETCRRCEPCLLHAIFKANAARRVANGIKNGLLSFKAEQSQIIGFNEIWETWIERWGQVKTVDAVIASMCEAEARYQDTRRLVLEIKAQKREKKQ